MGFLPNCGCVSTTVWMHYINSTKCIEKKAKWELYKNVTACFELPPISQAIQVR